MVKAYKLNDDTFGQTAEIFGLEVLVPYSGFGKDDTAWKTARFRLSNNQGCDEHCSPRCVTIQRQGVCVCSFIFLPIFKIVRPQGLSVQHQYYD